MTTDLHGIISAYRDSPELGVLVQGRTASALTFAGRYRLVDFALSSMRLAGVRNVGVIMQKEYQSLMDHIGSGKDWDFSRKSGGISLLPPSAWTPPAAVSIPACWRHCSARRAI